jgi:DNA-binding MarR family transcriptional regulator
LTEPARPHLDAETIALRRLQTELMLAFSRVDQQILRRAGMLLSRGGFDALTPSQADALIVLFNARRPINARELARALGVTEVTVSRFLHRMVEQGWVERTPDPNDGRAMLLRTTRYARERFPELVEVSNAVLDDVFDGFDRADLDALSELVGRIQRNLAPKTGLGA